MTTTLTEQWDTAYLKEAHDVKGYDHKLISKQLQSLVGKNVQHYFTMTDEVLVKWNGEWVEFDAYNKVFKVLV